jgi:phosphatidate cytidylyltransferase
LNSLATRVATGIVLVAAVLAALFLLPPPGWAIVALAIITAAAHEWAALIGLAGATRWLYAGATLAAGAALAWGTLGASSTTIVGVACGLATLFWIAVATPCVLLARLPASPAALALCGWIALLGALVAVVALQALSPAIALAAMAIVWIADTAAYFAGRRFGRRRLAPRVSPAKTWEGAYGGVAAVVVYALAVLPFAARAGHGAPLRAGAVTLWIVFGAALAALSIVGDLYESLLKRRAGVKDSGTLLPGHGGILDRTDALLAAMPPAALAATALFAGR